MSKLFAKRARVFTVETIEMLEKNDLLLVPLTVFPTIAEAGWWGKLR